MTYGKCQPVAGELLASSLEGLLLAPVESSSVGETPDAAVEGEEQDPSVSLPVVDSVVSNEAEHKSEESDDNDRGLERKLVI